MKRDMDLIRQLMLNLENDSRLAPEGYEKDVVTYHQALLIEAGLAKGSILPGDDIPKAVILGGLTWQGHEFLDAARSEEGWRQVTQSIAKVAGTVSLSMLQALLNQWAAAKLGLLSK